MERVLVYGGRDFADESAMREALSTLAAGTLVIHGGCRGADLLAASVARAMGLSVLEFRADWSLGRRAGPLRNRRMLHDGRPTRAIEFPGGKGTANMRGLLIEAKVPVLRWGVHGS